jgi:hypothetical protein
VCQSQTSNNKFSSLGAPRKIWAVSSIHGDIDRLINIHDAVFSQVRPGDRVVYLGNYTGYGDYSRETVEEILMFRRLLLAQPGMKPSDIVYLRGRQEANWQKLLQLHFQQFPVDALLTLLGAGMGKTLQSYGLCAHDGVMAAREGIYYLNKWISEVRVRLKENAGHECFMTHQKRAAYTSFDSERFPVLFVNAGINQLKRFDEHDADFWEAEVDFRDMREPFAPFEKVIRGFDPTHQGIYLNGVSASLDGGCGFGGSLVCASMDGAGDIDQLMEA